MRTEWVCGILRCSESRAQRKELLTALLRPTESDAYELLMLLKSMETDVLISQASRIIISNKSSNPIPKTKFDQDNLELISERLEISPKQTEKKLDKFIKQAPSARKNRPSTRAGIVSIVDYYRLTAYLTNCITLKEPGTYSKRRQRYGVTIVKAFRLILTAIELSSSTDYVPVRSQFKKRAIIQQPIQFEVVIKRS